MEDSKPPIGSIVRPNLSCATTIGAIPANDQTRFLTRLNQFGSCWEAASSEHGCRIYGLVCLLPRRPREGEVIRIIRHGKNSVVGELIQPEVRG